MKTSPFYDFVCVQKLQCKNDKFYNGKINKNFKTRYKEHTSEIKLKKLFYNQTLLNVL